MYCRFSLLSLLAALSFLSCTGNVRTERGESHVFKMRIAATREDSSPAGKVVIDGTELSWEGDEALSVVFGGSSSSSAATGLQASLSSVRPGIFEGNVDAGSWTVDDIQGVVVPAGLGAYYNYNSGSRRLTYILPPTQVQTQNGKLNPAYVPFFCPMNSGGSEVFSIEEDGTYTLDDLTLQWGCGLLRFNIYTSGASPAGMEDDEIFRSISMTTTNAHVVGTCHYNKAGSSSGAFAFSGNNTPKVELTEEVLLKPRTRDDGIVLYLAALPRGNGTSGSTHPTYIENITVTTDKAVYVYVPDEHVAVLTKVGRISKLGVNMAKFTRNKPVSYSIDGGATWTETLPGGTFSTLAVKTPKGSSISSAVLSEIVAAVSSQALVDLDLSACTYENAQFPAVFKGNTHLSGIKFPSNTTSLGAQAFNGCSALKSVDLTGITLLSATTGSANYYCFGSTALESVTIPSSISSYMVRSFWNCTKLKEIRYEASWNPTGTGFNYRTFRVGSDDGSAAKTVDCTLTVAPNVKSLPMSAFYGNNNLVKVVVEGDQCVFMNCVFNSCKNLATFELKGAVPPKINNANAYANVGALVEGDKKVIIPRGATASYKAHANWPAWETFMTARGFTLEEAGALPSEDGYMVLACGGTTTYNVAYTSAQASNTTTLVKAMRTATGVSFGSTAATSSNVMDLEIVIGEAAGRSECETALSGITYGYVIKPVGNKFIIAGTDEAWTSLAIEAFNTQVLKNPAYCGTGFLKIPAGFEYSETSDDPQLLARFIKEKRSFSMVAVQVATITYPANTTYKIAQGAVSDGTYVYFLLKKDESSSILLKYTLDTFEKVGETPFFNAYHANGITFDSKHNRVVLVHGQGDPTGLSLIDAETLAIEDIDISPVLLGGITYNAKRNIYGITRGGTLYKTLDENFLETNNFGRTDDTGYVAQDMGSDDSFVYFPMSKTGTDNLFVTYTWEGKYVTAIKIPVTYEIEDMFYAAGKYYAWFYSAGGKLYTVTPVLKCNLD